MQTKKQSVQLLVVFVALAAVIVTVGYTIRKKSSTRASIRTLRFDRTPERLARGRYIVEGPAHCFQCHSDVDYTKPGAQPKPGKKGAGAIFAEDSMSWLVAPNITPDVETGAGSWSDEQLARAIREGIGHDGRRLFPVMPYMNFRNMSDEDLASVTTLDQRFASMRRTGKTGDVVMHVNPRPLNACNPGLPGSRDDTANESHQKYRSRSHAEFMSV